MHSKLFMVYLLVVYGVAIMHSVRLVWGLSSLGARKGVSMQAIIDGEVDVEALAKSALSNRVLIESVRGAGPNSNENLSSLREKSALHTLRAADSRFRYIIGRYQGSAALLRQLVWLTLLLSSLVVIYGAFPTLADQFNDRNVTGSVAMLATVSLCFSRLSLGLAACAVLYAVSGIFTLMLQRRLNRWQYTYSLAALHGSIEPTRRTPKNDVL